MIPAPDPLQASPAAPAEGAARGDHRALVLRLLGTHRPADATEAAHLAHVSAFVTRHADCFGKTNALGHITGSAYVLDPLGRVLFTHHRKLDRWLQLGGHSNPDERDPADTALREANEESGLPDLVFWPDPRTPTLLDLDVHGIPARGHEPAHDHLDFRYLLRTRLPDAIVGNEESHALRWFDPAELLNVADDPGMRRALTKIIALLSLTFAETP